MTWWIICVNWKCYTKYSDTHPENKASSGGKLRFIVPSETNRISNNNFSWTYKWYISHLIWNELQHIETFPMCCAIFCVCIAFMRFIFIYIAIIVYITDYVHALKWPHIYTNIFEMEIHIPFNSPYQSVGWCM